MAARRSLVRGVAAVVLAAAVIGSVESRAAEIYAGPGDSYVVVLADSLAPQDVERLAGELVRRHGGTVESVYRDGFKGFTARLPPLAASGMRRDRRVVSVEALLEPALAERGADSPAEAAAKSIPPVSPRNARTPGEVLPVAPGPGPKFRRVTTPLADRYIVVLAESYGSLDAIADRLVNAHGGTRGPLDGDQFTVQMSESAALALSREAAVEYVREASSLAQVDPATRERRLPGAGLKRVASPVPDRYRVVLRATVTADELEATVSELMRAYEGRRRPEGHDDPHVVVVEMSESAALALSDDFRVESVEEQSAPARADR